MRSVRTQAPPGKDGKGRAGRFAYVVVAHKDPAAVARLARAIRQGSPSADVLVAWNGRLPASGLALLHAAGGPSIQTRRCSACAVPPTTYGVAGSWCTRMEPHPRSRMGRSAGDAAPTRRHTFSLIDRLQWTRAASEKVLHPCSTFTPGGLDSSPIADERRISTRRWPGSPLTPSCSSRDTS